MNCGRVKLVPVKHTVPVWTLVATVLTPTTSVADPSLAWPADVIAEHRTIVNGHVAQIQLLDAETTALPRPRPPSVGS